MFVAGIAVGMRARLVRRRSVRMRARIVGRRSSTVRLFHGSMGAGVTRFEVEVPMKDGRRVRVLLNDSIGDAEKDKLVGDGDTLLVFHPPGRPERARAWTRTRPAA